MTFVRDDIPEDQMYLFQQSRHFNNRGGEPIFSKDRIIDRERDMFLVCAGSAYRGPESEFETYVFYMQGLYISFEGRFDRSRKYMFQAEIPLPMNLANQTTRIMQDLEMALRIYMQGITKEPYTKPMDLSIIYKTVLWCIDKNEDVVLMSMGPAKGYISYQEMNEALFKFSQGEKEINGLYNFELRIRESEFDFQAYYRKSGGLPYWEVCEVSIPADFTYQTDTLLLWLEKALQKLPLLADKQPGGSPDMSGMIITAGPEPVVWSEKSGSKIYPSKFWGFIPGAPKYTSFKLSAQELDKLERGAQ